MARLTHTAAKTAKCTWGDCCWCYSNILIIFSIFFTWPGFRPSLSSLPTCASDLWAACSNCQSWGWFSVLKELLTPTLSEGYSPSLCICWATCIQIMSEIASFLSRFATHTYAHILFWILFSNFRNRLNWTSFLWGTRRWRAWMSHNVPTVLTLPLIRICSRHMHLENSQWAERYICIFFITLKM